MLSKDKAIEKISISELIDIEEFQDLATSFTSLTGIATAILDLEGNVIP